MAKKQKKNERQNPSAPAMPQVGHPQAAEPVSSPEPVKPKPRAPGTVSSEPPSRLKLGILPRYTILSVLLFLLMAYQGGGDDVFAGVLAAAFFLVCSVGIKPLWSMRHRLSLPVLTVVVYFVINLAASLYTRFGGVAAMEFGKITAAFCVFLLAILRVREGEAKPFCGMLASVSAAFALVSVDASSMGLLSRLFVSTMDALGCSFENMFIGYEAGTRVTGVFGNANILAGILALGVFLSLYLLFTAKTPRSALGAALLVGVNAVGFLLAFSMGAIGMFAVSVLLYFLLSAKEDRISLAILLAETGVLALLCMFLAFPGLGGTGIKTALSTAAPVLCGLLLWCVHWFGGRKASALLNRHGKAAWSAVAGLAALLAIYVILAYNVTGSYSMAPGDLLRRSVYPEAGSYTLDASSSGPVSVDIESQNSVQTITHTSQVLYSGPLDEASFTVPENTKVVYLTFSSAEGAELNTVSFSGGGPSVKLNYTLLPGFVANRIQGLWANQNAIQRTEFFMDGLRIYAKSPLIGSGLGGVNGLVTSVQRFYYESRYVHNHYIQTLAEMGIPGLLSFLALLGTTGAALLIHRKREGADPLLAALGAALAMTALHGATEAVWSIGQYQVFALLLVALIAVTYGRPVPLLTSKESSYGALAGGLLLAVLSGALLYGNWSATRAYTEVKAGLRQQTPYTMTELAKKDRYNWAQYKLDMAVNAAGSEVPEFAETAAKYAAELRKLHTYSINRSLSAYHYLTLGQYDELFAASREGLAQMASSPKVWEDEFQLYWSILSSGDSAVLDQIQWFADQILLTYDQFRANNEGRLEELRLTAQTSLFLEQVQQIKDSGATGAEAAALIAPMA